MEIRAPLSGVIVSLDSIPDTVFAGKLVGDGVSIDPTSNEVLAPVSGVLSQFHQSRHALAVTAPNGIEVLIHVGLDTVSLRGRGFTPLSELGAPVRLGQPLLRFDAELVAHQARSLLTQVIVTTGELVARLTPSTGLAVAGETRLLELVLRPGDESGHASSPEPWLSSQPIGLPNRQGLHARPAALLATRAKKYVAELRLARGTAEANAKSVLSILALSTQRGELVELRARGPDAEVALAELSTLLAEGCGEEVEVPGSTAPAPRGPLVAGALSGDPASPGVAFGRVVQHRRVAGSIAERGGTVAEERVKLARGLGEATLQLEALSRRTGGGDRAQILGVHRELLEDPELAAAVDARLQRGSSAALAWHQAVMEQAATLEQLHSPLFKARAVDVRDVGARVLARLSGVAPTPLELPDDAVLIAEDLTPSDLASLDGRKLLGLCSTGGSPTSHVAILAGSMGVPAICGLDERALALPNGTAVLVDGSTGLLRVVEGEEDLAEAHEQVARQRARREREQSSALSVARTRDGHRVEVAANIGSLEEARAAVAGGAEGVGLMRSELMFYGQPTAPTEDEQAAAYLAMAEALGKERPFVVRTLDIGGDKPLPSVPLPLEANPSLGLRGIRVSLDRPGMFRAQLRAILRAAVVGNVHVLFPMISGLDELREAKRLLAEQQADGPSIEVGVMIEVPAAAVLAEQLAREADFFSIGTNDLTQYTLAMDRSHPMLAKHADAFHPAVLRMIGMTVEGAHQHGKWVGVCGGLASDPLAVPVLVGLGVDELSVGIPAIGSIKATLRRWSLGECQAVAEEVSRVGTAAEVRALLTERRGALVSAAAGG